MDLNARDGATRRFVLVQLDEQRGSGGFRDDRGHHSRASAARGPAARQTVGLTQPPIDTGFRSYRLAESNVTPWDGTGELDLLAAVDNLAEGRTSDDLLVEMMLRLGIDLVTPVSTRDVAGSTLYSLAGTLYAFFGTE